MIKSKKDEVKSASEMYSCYVTNPVAPTFPTVHQGCSLTVRVKGSSFTWQLLILQTGVIIFHTAVLYLSCFLYQGQIILNVQISLMVLDFF